MHEDPTARVRRPHPFYHERKAPHNHAGAPRSETSSMHVEASLAQASSNAAAQADTPVASLLLSGFHDTPVPMGKYYPTNWEQRNKNVPEAQAAPQRPPASGRQPSHIKSESEVPKQHITQTEAENQRRIAQYKRDMTAHTSMYLGHTTKSGLKLGPGFSIRGVTISDLRLGNGMPHKPSAPRLHPLGSPGPITPMELETTLAGGYLTKGLGPDRRAKDPALHSN